MVKELVHDPILLGLKSENATETDSQTALNLLDTLTAHKDTCVGMAANMIGVRKCIIAFLDESGRKPQYSVMFNPVIISQSGAYDTDEACLSLLGGARKCKRYKVIKVQFQTEDMKQRIKIYTGWTAQIIQHEIDHCNGILI